MFSNIERFFFLTKKGKTNLEAERIPKLLARFGNKVLMSNCAMFGRFPTVSS